jgi:uncharacterized membrane protein YfcA
MIHLLIGTIIGVVMGLTGAGGALVALPLFISLLDMDLKSASVLSLIAVMLASLSNFIFQRGKIDLKLLLLILGGSGIGSVVATPLKVITPNFAIASILVVVSSFALYQTWHQSQSRSSSHTEVSPMKGVSLGIILGLLTTLTGLGGGVLLVPIFLRYFRLDQDTAVRNSLVAVGLSSLFSFLLQLRLGPLLPDLHSMLVLSCGIILSAQGIRWFQKKLGQSTMQQARRLVFSAVVLYSLIMIFIKG